MTIHDITERIAGILVALRCERPIDWEVEAIRVNSELAPQHRLLSTMLFLPIARAKAIWANRSRDLVH